METILVTQDKSAEDSFSEAKKVLETQTEVAIKGKGRDTVKAVDVAELLKTDGLTTTKISIDTDEEEKEEKTFRTSTITIELKK